MGARSLSIKCAFVRCGFVFHPFSFSLPLFCLHPAPLCPASDERMVSPRGVGGVRQRQLHQCQCVPPPCEVSVVCLFVCCGSVFASACAQQRSSAVLRLLVHVLYVLCALYVLCPVFCISQPALCVAFATHTPMAIQTILFCSWTHTSLFPHAILLHVCLDSVACPRSIVSPLPPRVGWIRPTLVASFSPPKTTLTAPFCKQRLCLSLSLSSPPPPLLYSVK